MFVAGVPPEFEVFSYWTMIGEQPEGAVLAAAGEGVVEFIIVIMLVKPEHYGVK